MKNRKKVLIITNVILVSVLISVFAVMFLPTYSEPMYGGEEISAIYSGNKNNKNVSFMFNVYENADVVEDIVSVLEKYGVKATFFLGGCWADDNEKTVLLIKNSGNEIANHGYYHKDHKNLDYQSNYNEIKNTDTLIKDILGTNCNLFAPPSGSYSVDTLKACCDLGYKVIMWSKDTIDWRDKEENKLFYRATNQPTNGDLILMHPKAHTLSILPSVIEYYKRLNFSIVTVSENISD